MDSYLCFFKELFKKEKKFSPYQFQQDCFDKFIQGNSILLKAPTGSGKTWGALAPFVFAWSQWKKGNQSASDYPRKLIYSLPLRTLANSLYKEVKSRIENNLPDLQLQVTIQTGENSLDPLFEGDIIFTTIDQTLSNILTIPLSLPQKLANINAGAVISSYLIFDEFHLLEPQRALNTTISILNLIKQICPFCLMTATLSDKFLKNISELLNASIIEVEENDYKEFSFVKQKATKSVSVVDDTMNAENIIKHHKLKSLVICNTVDRCVGIYKKLKQRKKQENLNFELICIHSRFFQTDRKSKEKKIKEYFSKKSKSNVILVSTQIVEVGLDISCDIMHTEISPVNSFLQRIGRCARWGGAGKIFVYDVPEQKYSPYDNELCQSTLIHLVEIMNQRQNIDFYLAKKLINNILEEKENKIFIEIKNNDAWSGIKDCWQRNDKSSARELIRNINSITIVLLPENFKTNSLFKYDSLSINPYSLKSKIEKTVDEFEGEIPSFIFALEESNFFEDDNNDDEIKCLQSITPEDIPNHNILALNSNIIGYSKDFGLDFDGHIGFQSKQNKKQGKIPYSYNKDTYEEHIRWMLEIYEERIKDSLLFPIRRIQKIKYKNFNFDEIIEYIIIMHDYGKLNIKWQEIMNTYQEAKENHIDEQDEFLTHTDFDPGTDDKILMEDILKNLGIKKKPPHAGVGAFLSYCVLSDILKLARNDENHKILKIIFTTILRHHGAKTTKMPGYSISKEAIEFINNKLIKNIIPAFCVDDTTRFPFDKYKEKDFSTTLVIQFEEFFESIIYFLLVRVLRLCDQKSFEKNPFYMENTDG